MKQPRAKADAPPPSRGQRAAWKRIAARAAVGTVLGFTTTVVSAWYFAAEVRWDVPRYRRWIEWSRDGQVMELGIAASSVHSRRAWEPAGQLFSTWHGSRSPDWVANEFPPNHVPAGMPHGSEPWGWLGASNELKVHHTGASPFGSGYDGITVDLPRTNGEELAVGWPRLALTMGLYTPETDDGSVNTVERGIWYTPRWLRKNVLPQSSVAELPIRPIWFGLLFNTLFYGSIWFVLATGAFHARRYLRLTRGRCPVCRYDLSHNFTAGCPECGWRKTRTPA